MPPQVTLRLFCTTAVTMACSPFRREASRPVTALAAQMRCLTVCGAPPKDWAET